MPSTSRHRISVLKKCGFERVDSGRAPEEKWVLRRGTLLVRTSLPHGNKEIKKGTFSKILKQMLLNREEYSQFLGCHWNQNDYLQILRNQGVAQD